MSRERLPWLRFSPFDVNFEPPLDFAPSRKFFRNIKFILRCAQLTICNCFECFNLIWLLLLLLLYSFIFLRRNFHSTATIYFLLKAFDLCVVAIFLSFGFILLIIAKMIGRCAKSFAYVIQQDAIYSGRKTKISKSASSAVVTNGKARPNTSIEYIGVCAFAFVIQMCVSSSLFFCAA